MRIFHECGFKSNLRRFVFYFYIYGDRMKILLTILLITNIAQAADLKKPETDEKLNESLALSQHFKEFSKSQAGASFFTVGAGSCNYTSIQGAIDALSIVPSGTVEIRIATDKTYFENIIIDNSTENLTLSLIGGYADCSIAAASGSPSNGQSLINASQNGSVLTIKMTTQRRTVMIKNIRMINGNYIVGGGILSDRADVALLLENVDIRNNTANQGAGIAIVGGNTDLLMNESLVLGNVADSGGGIFCIGGSSSVNVANHSGIISNFSTSGLGGGAYIDACYFAIFTGSPNNSSFTGMEGNFGGAIYASSAILRLHGHQFCGSLGCLGDNMNPVSFRNNTGSVLVAINSEVRVNATWMEGNGGGSVISLSNTEFRLERFLQPCWSNSNCNLIENNDGTVISGSNINETNISNVTFQNNSGGVFDFFNISSVRIPINVESNIFYNNGSFPLTFGGTTVFDIFGAFDFSFIHNTIVDNNSTGSIFNLDYNAGIAGTVPPLFEAHSNIVDNPGALFLTHNANSAFNGITEIDVNISALITNETDSLLEINGVFNDAINFAGGDFISQTIPGEVLFVDRANGDLHLSPNSRAIDYFNTPSRAAVTYKDIDYQDRGFDDPNNQSPISSLFYFDLEQMKESNCQTLCLSMDLNSSIFIKKIQNHYRTFMFKNNKSNKV